MNQNSELDNNKYSGKISNTNDRFVYLGNGREEYLVSLYARLQH